MHPADRQSIHKLYLRAARLDRYISRRPFADLARVWSEVGEIQACAAKLRLSLLEEEHVDALCGDGRDHESP